MRNRRLNNACRYFSWLIIIGMVGTGSSIVAKDASHPRFPESWISTIDVQDQSTPPGFRPLVPISREYQGTTTGSEMTLRKTSEELTAVSSLPFHQERKERFSQLISATNITKDEWHHFSGQLKFRYEAEEFRLLWAAQTWEQSDRFSSP